MARSQTHLIAGEGIFHMALAGEADSLRSEAAALRRHAGFERAVAAYLDGLVRWREGSRLLHKLSAHEARMHVAGYLLHLSAIDVLAGGSGGVSYGALHALCVERRGEVGPRVFKTTLALMSLAGFVESWRDLSDRRVKLYRPTARMHDHARLAYGYAAAALDQLFPHAERVRRLREDTPFLLRMLASAGRAHADDPPGRLMPDFIAFIGQREGAGPLLAALLAAGGGEAPSRAALAARFGLSKTQVGQVMADGARLGYLTQAPQPAITAHLETTFRDWIAIELAFHARHMVP